MSDEIEFVPGLFVKPPHERAPDFVMASVSIKREELASWLQGKSDEWINIDVKESRGGKWYASVSNFKPREGAAPKPKSEPPKPASQAGGFNDFEDDIHFN